MANLDFFAAEDDQKAVLAFLFAETDVRLFELASEWGQELREFRTVAELAAAFPLGQDKHGNGLSVTLELWSPSVMGVPKMRRIALNPEACDGHTFRWALDGGGAIQLYLGGLHGRVLSHSHFGHNSHTRAKNWGFDQGTDWDALKTLSNRIQYHVRKRLAVAKAKSRPILAQAYALALAGVALESAEAPWRYELPPLALVPKRRGVRKPA